LGNATLMRTRRRSFLTSYYLLGCPRRSVEQSESETSCRNASHKHHTDYPTGRQSLFSRLTASKLLIQIRHMRFRSEPFIL
jgi:hypothetical protein